MVQLPEYENSPLIETVMSVQFEQITSLKLPEMAKLWLHFQNDFPHMEAQPELPTSIEQFGVPNIKPNRIKFEFADSPFDCRMWYLNQDGTELLQIQKDRFIRNWRKNDTDLSYPRYPILKERFIRDFNSFQGALQHNGIGEVRVNQCEVTYVNIVPIGGGANEPCDLGDVITVFMRPKGGDFGDFEEATVSMRYLLGAQDAPIGRLYVEATPVMRAVDNSAAIRVTLTARGRPTSDGLEGILEFFDIARQSIVQGFTNLTTDKMHEQWGRKS